MNDADRAGDWDTARSGHVDLKPETESPQNGNFLVQSNFILQFAKVKKVAYNQLEFLEPSLSQNCVASPSAVFSKVVFEKRVPHLVRDHLENLLQKSWRAREKKT